MDKYKKLLSNTLIFAIGMFSSKLLTFFMVPFYTNVLTENELGTAGLVVQAANLLIPVVSCGVANSIIRYGLDRTFRKRDVFTAGVTMVAAGYLLFFLFRPLIAKIPLIHDYTSLIYLYVLTSCLRSLCSQFIRARELVRLYAFDGVLSIITVITCNILFLSVLKLGITGYVLATIISDALSALFLFTIASLHRYIRFRRMDWSVAGSMLRFSLPLIPTTLFWWITNVSDRYMVSYFISADANGLYDLAYKVPTMITVVSGIFSDAWQMSAFTEKGPGRDRFFSNIFNAYQALIFTAASGLILFCKPITAMLVLGPKNAFYPAWQYIPLLVIATVFSCFVTFLGSIYMVGRKSIATLLTTILGAAVNVGLNLLLIPDPKFGVNGAAFATFMSYLVVFLVRIADTRRIVRLRWRPFKLLVNLFLLLFQTWILLSFQEDWILPEILLCLLVILLNLKQIVINIDRFLRRRRAPRLPGAT